MSTALLKVKPNYPSPVPKENNIINCWQIDIQNVCNQKIKGKHCIIKVSINRKYISSPPEFCVVLGCNVHGGTIPRSLFQKRCPHFSSCWE